MYPNHVNGSLNAGLVRGVEVMLVPFAFTTTVRYPSVVFQGTNVDSRMCDQYKTGPVIYIPEVVEKKKKKAQGDSTKKLNANHVFRPTTLHVQTQVPARGLYVGISLLDRFSISTADSTMLLTPLYPQTNIKASSQKAGQKKEQAK